MENGKWKVSFALPGFLFILSSTAWAHDGKPHNFADLWHAWSFDPLIIVSLALFAWIYIQGVFNLWRSAKKGRGIKTWEALAFAGGWLSLFVALVAASSVGRSFVFGAYDAARDSNAHQCAAFNFKQAARCNNVGDAAKVARRCEKRN
ncbi:hypothetical protein BH24ACI2_BH24ACI2_05440 [soil metagenome]|jgi:hypothetical protein